MAEIDRVNSGQAKVGQALSPANPPDPLVCPHCQTRMDKPMKFCGECGKPMGAKA